MKAFFDMMDKDPRKVMILGGSCNSVTDSIAKTSKHWRIPVVSAASCAPSFISSVSRAPLFLAGQSIGGQGRSLLFFPFSFS
jgi:CO dehydrogenase/acetyl-CoA synthase epsilon subunit